MLACPSCNQLVHAEALKHTAREAEQAESSGDRTAAVTRWQKVLELLPPEAVQYGRVQEKIRALSAIAPERGVVPETGSALAGEPSAPRGRYKWAAGLGAVGAFLAKLKWILLFALGKAKILLAGLTQAKTFVSMAIAIGVYTLAYGWRFAVGLVLSIYVHEMGHVVWLRRYGIAATAPMFIPGLGAFVRLKQYPASAAEDARVGLAGPVWGAGAAAFALVAGLASHQHIFIVIARVGAWINLFNLLPVWQLDGGRGFSALSQRQRGVVAGVLWVLFLTMHEGLLLLLALAATVRAIGPRKSSAGSDAAPQNASGAAPSVGDVPVLFTYLALVIGLALFVALIDAENGTPI